jgi:isoleucyl-tRNA synthetase
VHHVLARVFKDMFPRYKIMRGYHVSRRGGWDTHGLPVEIEVEKQLGFNNKQQIEEYGIDKFNELCKKSVFTYIQDWEKLTDRIAFWVDLEDAYVTYTNDYIESVWWISGIRTCFSRATRLFLIVRVAARLFRTMKWLSATRKQLTLRSLFVCRW